jgi:triosephosphate isomerase
MARRPLIAGNWKMNTTLDEAQRLASAVAAGVFRGDVDVLLVPPFPWLKVVADITAGSRSGVRVGAQTCSDQTGGAFTGEVAATMLAGVASAILDGHSERRQRLGETDEIVRAKLDRILDADLLPVLCCGEALDIRQAGQADAWVTRQLEAALGGRSAADIARVVIAYEPIWAIGTGVAATPDDAQAMAATIRAVIARLAGDEVADGIQILYGGSVTAANASTLLALPDVDGALVGGASLKAADFLAIVAAAPVRV